MLEEYARRNGFPRPTHFTDDGISGTRFDRPGFTAMMEEVEAVIVKDMSRLGRDYLKVGQIMEILRQKNVRLIAVNDGVDSALNEDDFTPFRNIMNEFFVRDTSRKIKSVFKAKGMSGKHLTGTVIYGYLWDEKREHWIVDEEAATVVRRIFAMTMAGYGPYQIAKKLSEERIEIPSVHMARYGEGLNKNKTFKDIYGWGEAHPLTGLMYCADCGGKMYIHRTNNGKRIPQYTYSQYSKVPVGTLCPTQHRINADVVLTLFADTLRAIAAYSKNDQAEFIQTVKDAQVAQQSGCIAQKKKRLAEAKKRSEDLEKLLCQIYEDKILGKLPEARFATLDARYADE